METSKIDLTARIKALTFSTTLLFALVVSFPLAEVAFRHILYKSYTNPTFIINSTFHFLLIYLIADWLYLSETKSHFRRLSLQSPDVQRLEQFNLITDWIKSGTRKPVHVYFYSSERIDAFAFGTRNHRFIAISSKALDRLNDDELRILVFHELSHHIFGDVWKFKFARYLTIVYLVFEVITSINKLIVNVQVGGTGQSELLRWLPDVVGLFPFAVMAIGILAIIRLRELVADSFAVLQTDKPDSLKDLFVKLSIDRLSSTTHTTRISLVQKLMPKQFSYYPDSRLSLINDSNSIFNETYLLAAYVGLVLGAFTGIPGDVEVLILFSLPIISIVGCILLLYILAPLGLKKDYIKEIFALTGTAALTSTLLTLAWRIGVQSNPLGSSPTPNVNRIEFYFNPWLRFFHESSKVLDNDLLILSIGSLFIVIFFYLSVNFSKLVKRLFPRLVSPEILSGWIILVVLAIPFLILWGNLFGEYMLYAISLTS